MLNLISYRVGCNEKEKNNVLNDKITNSKSNDDGGDSNNKK
jgi:hypothetical protein